MRFALGLLLLLMLVAPAQAQRACDHFTAFQHSAPTGPVEIVPADLSLRVYFCGFLLTQIGPTLDFSILVGHGINCGTDTINLVTLSLPNDVVLVNRIPTVGPTADYGYAMCLQTSTTKSGTPPKLGGILYWSQF
jgi:hypothetical protein